MFLSTNIPTSLLYTIEFHSRNELFNATAQNCHSSSSVWDQLRIDSQKYFVIDAMQCHDLRIDCHRDWNKLISCMHSGISILNVDYTIILQSPRTECYTNIYALLIRFFSCSALRFTEKVCMPNARISPNFLNFHWIFLHFVRIHEFSLSPFLFPCHWSMRIPEFCLILDFGKQPIEHAIWHASRENRP